MPVRLALLGVVASVGALATAALAPTKEGARARMTTSLPLGATPGTTIRIGWSVEVEGGDGVRRPFYATGMFVRLLSKTGAPSTIAVSRQSGHPGGRYAVRMRVPAGGIGGIRMGQRGSTEISFPLRNDPFESPGGVRCDATALRATLTAFVGAYNVGDLPLLDQLFSRERFVWYSSGDPGVRLLPEAGNRETLVSYFQQRHGSGDRLTLVTYRFNRYDRQRDLGQFQLRVERRADDFRGGRPFQIAGKGAIDCSKPPVTLAVMSLGGPERS